MRTYANGYRTWDGGTALAGFRGGLTRAIHSILRARNLPDTLPGAPIRSGLVSVVAVHLPSPMFESQMRNRLNNPEAEGLVRTLTAQCVARFFRDHPDEANAILTHLRQTTR